jgi:hypothetical protein
MWKEGQRSEGERKRTLCFGLSFSFSLLLPAFRFPRCAPH